MDNEPTISATRFERRWPLYMLATLGVGAFVFILLASTVSAYEYDTQTNTKAFSGTTSQVINSATSSSSVTTLVGVTSTSVGGTSTATITCNTETIAVVNGYQGPYIPLFKACIGYSPKYAGSAANSAAVVSYIAGTYTPPSAGTVTVDTTVETEELQGIIGIIGTFGIFLATLFGTIALLRWKQG